MIVLSKFYFTLDKKLFLGEVVHKPMGKEEHDSMENEKIGNPLEMSK